MSDERPWEEALEAYKRAHPRRADEVDEAFAQGTLDDSEAGEPVPAGAGEHDPAPASEQLALSDPDANQLGKFQASGAAETQRLAAVNAYPTSGTARRRVLDAVAQADEAGLTDEEMQDGLRMNPSTQRPRRVELVEGGWVEKSEMKRKTHSGDLAVVWVLTRRGRAEWSPPRGTTWEP